MALTNSVSTDSTSHPREDPLYQVKLLSALRSGDPAQIHPFLAEISKEPRKSIDTDSSRGAAALHLAIRCATCDTISLLLSHRAISPNAVYPPGSGTTPLHLAASLSRPDVVSLLFEQDQIDDTVRDAQGKTCLEVAKGKETVYAIKDSRAFLTVSYRSLLRTYVFSHPSDRLPSALNDLLSSPRSRHIDLSYLDESSGTTILHEAARRKDIKAIELAIRGGADIFVRDRKGRTVYESVGKDDRVKAFLRQFTNQDISLIEPPSSEPPEHKGYLNKYTNVARGYNTRWFVLRHGVLSYYRHQEDEGVASRGSISMKTAVLKSTPGTGGLRFEVQSTPTRGHAQKWYMKANHPVEASRWLQALNKSIEWSRREGASSTADGNNASGSGSGNGSQRKSGESEANSVRAPSYRTSGVGGGTATPSIMSFSRSKRSEGESTYSRVERFTSNASSTYAEDSSDSMPQHHRRNGSGLLSVKGGGIGGIGGGGEGSGKESGKETEDSSVEETERFPPFRNSFELQGNTTVAQLELTGQMVMQVMQALPPSASASTSSPQAQAQDIHKALAESLSSTQSLLSEYVQMVKEREEWWKDQLERERQRQDVWEESLRAVVREGEELERELRNKSRRRSTRVTMTESGYGLVGGVSVSEMGTLRGRASFGGLGSPPVVMEEGETPRVASPSAIAAGVGKGIVSLPDGAGVVVTPPPQTSTTTTTTITDSTAEGVTTPKALPGAISPPLPTMAPSPTKQSSAGTTLTVTSPLMAPSVSRPFSLIMNKGGQVETASMVDTDEEDEFFDAIESNTLPNLVVTEEISHRGPATSYEEETLALAAKSAGTGAAVAGVGDEKVGAVVAMKKKLMVIDKEQYGGYAKLRERLKISSDDRPPMSLWAVLKNSIGKDLTKISFPVFFNEPTSMLQRMAEDMEFSECLDAAAAEKDPHRRIAFVAGFAMSNYSSTIGRIAKPFNPMLSETFEYVRLDKEYRYFSEQVSHHPPMSACWAESPKWRYYGEVDAQNKFMGKSFEIRPTGVAHADLLLPEELGPDYPKAKGGFLAGKVVEHYSWKKVTTNISGFILGSPTIDHYGDMIAINVSLLSSLEDGARDASNLSYVMDMHGTVTYEIAGRWNSQLVARETGTGVGHLHPDVSINSPSNSNSSPSYISNASSKAPEYILLWRNSEKPTAPFNLTPFAITLNDCPDDTLRPYLCPTDCRLRPDQRAFELGRYEHANGLKNKQEELQRATRKAREEGKIEAHRPRWFKAVTEEDTGERVWVPEKVDGERVEYWVRREEVWKSAKEGKKGAWKDVEPIFIEDDP